MARSRRAFRRKPNLPVKPLLIVVTEGEKTEPLYIQEFNRIHRAPNVQVVPTGFDPQRVVEKAIAMKRTVSRGAKAHIWAVFDRDEHERFDRALQLARQHEIGVATSNPCFELWAVFHYRDYAAPIERHPCQRLLEGLCKSYRADRAKLFNDAQVIRAGHENAVRRGKESLHNREAEGDPGGNPSTSMHELTESIHTHDSG